MSAYTVKSIFPTIQGEGFYSGVPAVFCRFSSCNMWSGVDAHRARDAERNQARCPLWCDTDFRGGDRFDSEQLAIAVAGIQTVQHLVVITGGEPLLQLDQELIDALLRYLRMGTRIAVETNGTVEPQFDADAGLVWITMSPKRSRALTVLRWCDELKLVHPAYDPAEWADFPARHRWIQPCDVTVGSETPVPESLLVRQAAVHRDAAAFVAGQDAGWRMSAQAHKLWGVP